jgi:hypothetical protein
MATHFRKYISNASQTYFSKTCLVVKTALCTYECSIGAFSVKYRLQVEVWTKNTGLFLTLHFSPLAVTMS